MINFDSSIVCIGTDHHHQIVYNKKKGKKKRVYNTLYKRSRIRNDIFHLFIWAVSIVLLFCNNFIDLDPFSFSTVFFSFSYQISHTKCYWWSDILMNVNNNNDNKKGVQKDMNNKNTRLIIWLFMILFGFVHIFFSVCVFPYLDFWISL